MQSQATTVGRPIHMLSVFIKVRIIVLLLRNPVYKSLPAVTQKFSFGKDVHLSSYVFQSL